MEKILDGYSCEDKSISKEGLQKIQKSVKFRNKTILQRIADELSDKARYCMRYDDPNLSAYASSVEDRERIQALQVTI